MKKLCVFLLCLLLVAPLFPLPARALASASGALASLKSPSAILMHESGAILFEKDAHTPREPASVTKVMTLLLTMEALERGQIALDDIVTASPHAASMGGSQIWLEEGEQFSVDELIKCVAVSSANDCAVALAEHISGTEEAFVALMNERAAELGMKDTSFKNACGLDAEGHLTSAYDIALMSLALIKHEKIQDYTLIWQDTIRNGEFTLTNTNKLVRSYPGLTGLKTGSTNRAGFCLAATAARDGMSLVAVVMSAPSGDVRSADITAMLNYGFANYSAVQLTADQPILPVEVLLGKESHVVCDLADSSPVLIAKQQINAIEKTIQIAKSVSAPVKAGQEVGMLTVKAEGETVAQIPIVAQTDVERLSLWNIFTALFQVCGMRK